MFQTDSGEPFVINNTLYGLVSFNTMQYPEQYEDKDEDLEEEKMKIAVIDVEAHMDWIRAALE